MKTFNFICDILFVSYVFGCVLIIIFGSGCMNKIQTEVPAKIEQCFKDDVTGKCTTTLTVKHVITIEMPEAFVNDCEGRYKDVAEPERTILIQQCISDYTSQIIDVINNIQLPATLPSGT